MKAENESETDSAAMSDKGRTSHQEWVRSIVESHSASLTRYASSITGEIDSARDAVQDTFLRLVRADAEKISGHVVPWLFRVCRNLALDHNRKEGRMTPLQNSHIAEEVAADRSPSEEAERGEASELVMKTLEDLPAKQREVVRLKFQNGFSYKEIAEVMELSVSNVGFLIHTAIKNLRERLREETDLLGSCRP